MAIFGWLAWGPLRLILAGHANSYLILMLAFYLLLVLVYLFRPPPAVPAIGPLERHLPLAVTFAPAAILRLHPTAAPPQGAILTCSLGVALALWGLIHLRGNFSIMVEGRALVTSGPYRWIRHPIYLGEIITLAGLVWLSPHPVTIAGALLIGCGQLWRAWLEERKLARCFGDRFDAYRRRSVWFPAPGAGRDGAPPPPSGG